MPSMRILEESRVSPPPSSVEPSAAVLTHMDIVFMDFDSPIEFIFFYPSPRATSFFIESQLPNLRSSLSLTLQHFYTLAGTLRRSPNFEEQFELHYTEGDSVPFMVLESHDDFHELSSGGNSRNLTRIRPLVPRLEAAPGRPDAPPLAVQVTVFPDHGVCICVAIHHAAADAMSCFHFVKSWALACKFISGGVGAVPLPSLPIYARGPNVQPPELYSAIYNQLNLQSRTPKLMKPLGEVNVSKTEGAQLASFKLGADHILRHKQRVSNSSELIHCSTFVVSCAHAWLCYVRARGYAVDQTVHFIIPANIRGRLNPPVPTTYFGNCLKPCFVKERVGVLLGVDGIVAAAVVIGKTIGELNAETDVLHDIGGFLEKFATIGEEKTCTVASSPKVRAYDTDFGWGRPIGVEMPSIGSFDAISLVEAKEDDRGVEIGVVLEKREMDAFEYHFYRALQDEED